MHFDRKGWVIRKNACGNFRLSVQWALDWLRYSNLKKSEYQMSDLITSVSGWESSVWFGLFNKLLHWFINENSTIKQFVHELGKAKTNFFAVSCSVKKTLACVTYSETLVPARLRSTPLKSQSSPENSDVLQKQYKFTFLTQQKPGLCHKRPGPHALCFRQKLAS